MWVALKRASCRVVAFGGSVKSRLVTATARSDVPLLWRRLVVVAPTRRRQSAECSTKSQWGAAWCQLCHALQSCKLVPAWDPIHGSRPGSSLGCLAATGRMQWTLASPAAVAGQCRERGKLGAIYMYKCINCIKTVIMSTVRITLRRRLEVKLCTRN